MHGTQWGGVDGFVSVESIDTDGNSTFYYYDGSYDFTSDSGNGNVATVSVDEAVAFEASMNVYPNPTVGEATLNFVVATSTEVSYQIVDMVGKVVANNALGTLAPGEQRVTLDMNNLEAGVYMINVTAGSTVASTRITIAK
ncbi:MAG: T9SS type A sorting domain-containing protein [Flavobacteriales bacterium]|nr:T9SS type A sorting domain-containing protein [Flavobacteriales bacterium]